MKHSFKLSSIIGLTISLIAACSTTTVQEESDPDKVFTKENFINDVCSFGRTKSATYVTQSIQIGDYSRVGAITQRSQIPADKYSAAIATPRSDLIRHEYTKAGTCKRSFTDAWGRTNFVVAYFPDCKYTEKFETDDVFGLARADTIYEAEDLAIDNCEASIDKLIRKHSVLDEYYDDLECTVISKSNCI